MLQCLVVIADDWEVSEGTLYVFERLAHDAPWKMARKSIAVGIGKKGMGWGLGIHAHQMEPGEPIKREGDLKTPAGVFALGPVFGHPELPPDLKMLSLLIDDTLECVDDPRSSFYNQFVRASEVKDWTSSEQMNHPLYCCGLVIDHNMTPPVPGAGSCIFMHCLREKGSGTAGCTAMQEQELRSLLLWLDSEKHPCIVQLPLPVYKRLASAWKLPRLPDED